MTIKMRSDVETENTNVTQLSRPICSVDAHSTGSSYNETSFAKMLASSNLVSICGRCRTCMNIVVVCVIFVN